MSLQRPPTRERQQGSIPLTVLEPTASLMGTCAAATSTGVHGFSQEQQLVEPMSTSGAGLESWQQQQATNHSTADRQQQQEQPLATASNKVSLKVRLWAMKQFAGGRLTCCFCLSRQHRAKFELSGHLQATSDTFKSHPE
eukprot:GHRQ01029378.1.p2 GENE.GHRQ01029378.1~~GHRQ01029378.1.p2  ORF type:complete len:140 (+),score=34.17 GHRQ01029378.1:382-801(+)